MYTCLYCHNGSEIWRTVYADDTTHAMKIAEARGRRQKWVLVFVRMI
jgi:hypothetical protein